MRRSPRESCDRRVAVALVHCHRGFRHPPVCRRPEIRSRRRRASCDFARVAAHPKLTNPVVDFAAPPADADWWSVDGVISALGTTQRIAGSPEAFRAVDYGYTLAVARLAHERLATRFALTSSLGADPAARSSFYLRTKGEIERDVEAIGFASLTIVRPGLLGGTRSERRLAEDVGKLALGLIGPILPARWRISQPERVAEVLVEAIAAGRPGRRVIDRLI